MNLLIRKTLSRTTRRFPSQVPTSVPRPRPPADLSRDLLELIESGDICSLLSLMILLLILARVALQFRPRWQSTVFRIGAFSFVGLLTFLTIRTGVRDAAALVATVFRTMLFSTMIASCSAIVLPLVEFIVVDFLGWPCRRWREWRFQRAVRNLSRRNEPLERWKQEHDERERQRLARLDTETRFQQQRRDNARFACQVLYDRYRARIEAKFSQDQLQKHFDRYLSDSLPADEFEQRIAQLKELILELADSDGRGRTRFRNLLEIRNFYHNQQQAVLNSAYSEDIKQSLLSDLAREEARVIRESRQL